MFLRYPLSMLFNQLYQGFYQREIVAIHAVAVKITIKTDLIFIDRYFN